MPIRSSMLISILILFFDIFGSWINSRLIGIEVMSMII